MHNRYVAVLDGQYKIRLMLENNEDNYSPHVFIGRLGSVPASELEHHLIILQESVDATLVQLSKQADAMGTARKANGVN